MLDWGLIGARFEAWAELTLHDASIPHLHRFCELVRTSPSIHSAYQLPRPQDILVHVIAPSSCGWKDFLASASLLGFGLDVTRATIILDCLKMPAGATVSLLSDGAAR